MRDDQEATRRAAEGRVEDAGGSARPGHDGAAPLRTRSRAPLAAAIGLAVAVGAAAAPPPSVGTADADHGIDELTALVERLRAEVDVLRAERDDRWLTERRAEEIHGLVQDVLADADTRASLLQSGVTAGHDGKFFLASADGAFRLNVAGQIQVRYVYSHRALDPMSANPQPDESRGGFEVRRAKLFFTGHLGDPTWTFEVRGAFDRNGGSLDAEDVWISKDLGGGWFAAAGQFKPPFLAEELNSDARLLAVERSLVNGRFSQTWSIGAEVGYRDERFRARGMLHNGLRSLNAPWNTEDTEFAIAARAEFLLAGDWSQFTDFTSPPGSELGFMIGAAFNYQAQEYGTTGPGPNGDPRVAPGVDDEIIDFRATVDASLQGDGWNAFAAFVMVDLDDDDTGPGRVDTRPWGVVVQGGLHLSEAWEVFARYEFGDNDDGSEDLRIVTVGLNRYWRGQSLKWQTDVGYGLNEVGSAWASSGAGWLQDDPGREGQVVLRSQVQLLF